MSSVVVSRNANGSELLLTPGPVMVPDAVLAASSLPPLYHKSQEFLDIARSVWQSLQALLGTSNPVVLLSGSAMSGMEAVQTSLVPRDAHVLVVVHGRFGERLSHIARTHGSEVDVLEVPWGETVTPELISSYMTTSGKAYVATWLVHSETSTGVTLDITNCIRAIRTFNPDTLVCVDGVLSVGIEPISFDESGIDALIFGLQKGLMTPPGMAGIALSTNALRSLEAQHIPSYTHNLHTVVSDFRAGRFTWTPPVTILRALDVSLSLIHREGKENVWQRCRTNTDYLQAQLLRRGLSLFGHHSSHGVTVVEHANASMIVDRLLEEHHIRIAHGQDHRYHDLFRIATCGMVNTTHLDTLLGALDRIL